MTKEEKIAIGKKMAEDFAKDHGLEKRTTPPTPEEKQRVRDMLKEMEADAKRKQAEREQKK